MKEIDIGRSKISGTIFENLYDGYNNKSIQLYECPTGSGKTIILLESAARLMAKFGTSVIISTSTNELALEFLKEKNLHDVKKIYGMEINVDDVELMLGIGNFLDIEMVELMVKLDPSLNINIDEVHQWYNTFENRKLVSKFLKDFNLDSSMAEILNLSESDKDETIVSVKNFPNCLCNGDKPKIYITNHLFLITLVEILSHNQGNNVDFNSIPILLDEGHDLKKMAKLRYSSNFSPYRLNFLLKSIKNDESNNANSQAIKQLNKLKEDARLLFEKTQNTKNLMLNCDDIGFEEYYNTLKAFYENYKNNDFFKILDSYQKKNKDQIMIRKVLKVKREFSELVSVIGHTQIQYKQINFSPRKGYATIISHKGNVKIELRHHFWQYIGYVLLLSGTLRKMAGDTTLVKNKWAMERLGLYPYKERDNILLNESQLNFNEKLNKNTFFKVFPWIFARQNFKYILLTDKNLQAKRGTRKQSFEILDETEDWANEVAKFFSFYYEDLFSLKNTLILANSYLAAEILAKALKEKNIPKEKIFFEQKNISIQSTFNDYKKAVHSQQGNSLIGTLTMFTGYDFIDELCGYIIMTKLPFVPRIRNVKSQIQKEEEKFEMTYLFRQGSGRGSRSENDKVALFVLDSRIENRQRHLVEFLEEMGENIDFKEIKAKLGDYNEQSI